MKVLLAIAPWSYETVHPGSMGKRGLLERIVGAVGGAAEPLGLLYLSSCLEGEGHAVELLDGALVSEDEILARAVALQPELIGLSAMMHNWPATQALARRLTQRLPGVPIVLGGPQATCWREETLTECEAIDFAVVGEGEDALVELCEALEGRGSLDDVRGLIRRQGEGFVANPPRPPRADLDAIPFPAYDKIDIRSYRPSVGFYNKLPSMNMMTSRGCPHRCSFCISEGRLQLRSVENVLEELSFMTRTHGIRHVTFYDEGLTFSRERTLALCEGIQRAGLDISWCANARVDRVDGELLRAMKAAGCWKILYGLESGVQKNLDAILKGTRVEQAEHALRLTRRAGIETFGTFLFGIPGETFAEGLRTIDFACSLPLDYAAFLNLVPYKGSAIYDDLHEHGVLTGKWSTNLISFVPHSMSREELVQLNVLAARRFYRRPRYLARRLLSLRSVEDVKRNLRGLVAFPRIKPSDY